MSRLRIAGALCALVIAAGCSGGSDLAGGDGGGGGSTPGAPTPVQQPPNNNCSVPAEPSNLTVTSVDTRVTLTWSAVSSAVDYIVLIGSSPGTSNLVNTNTTQTTFQWNGARVGTSYARVAAHNACGTSTSAREVAFTVTSAD